MSETTSKPLADTAAAAAGGDSSTKSRETTTSEKEKENRQNSNSTTIKKPQQQPPQLAQWPRNQQPRRGSSSGSGNGGNNYQQRRGSQGQGGQNKKGQRHYSHGGGDPGEDSIQNNYDRRRHSMDTKKYKKLKDAAAVGTAANAGTKNPRFSNSRYRNSLSESGQNGGSGDYDYYTDDFELEEPFSESDEEETTAEARRKRQAKPQLLLPMPRRRIRTLSGTIPTVGYAPVWGGPTMCLSCMEFFDLPSQTSAYIGHLLEKHKIVITDIELIVDLKRYIEYWRHRFGQESIDKIFPLMAPTEKDPLFGKVENYYLISEVIPEDRQIREKLALRRLDEVLQCQQREREDRTFRRQCLFCRYRSTGNRAKLIHHLYTIHHLNLGSPDNLVFINEYMDVLEGKMKNNECIYCEKAFSDHLTLADHMRRKQHREVNPKNNYYDRFYVINYLELGKRWLEVLAEDFEDTTPTFVDSDEEEEEETWNEWQEENEDENEVNAICLFCDDSFHKCQSLLDHMKEAHKYDFKQIIADEKLDFYECVKLINYIRKQSYNLTCFVCSKNDLRPRSALNEHLETDGHLITKLDKTVWNKEEYLIPTYDNDNILLLLGEIVEDHQQDDEDVFEGTPRRMSAAGDHEIKSSSIAVIPEDPPELEETVLNDPELRDQLK